MNPNGTPFVVPPGIRESLRRCVCLVSPRIHTDAFWFSMINAHRTKSLAAELLKADAWCVANPRRAPKTNQARFLNTWFERAMVDDE